MKHQIDTKDLSYVLKRIDSPIVGVLPCPIEKTTGKINPQTTSFLREDEKVTSVFHVKPIYYETLSGHWRPLSEVARHYGNRHIVFTLKGYSQVHPRYMSWLSKRMELVKGDILVESPISNHPIPLSPYISYLHDLVTVSKLGMTVTTVYPDPNPETSTFDAYQFQTNASWSTLRASATGGVDDTSANEAAFIGERITNYNIGRCEYLFDTSAIGSDTIDDATFSLYYQGTKNTSESTHPCNGALVSSNPASNTGATNTDYANYGSTRYADTDVTNASLSATTYYDWVMNATGEAAIAKSGITKLGIRPSNDFSDSTVPSARSFAKFYFADQSGTTNDPKFVVTHTAGGGANTTNFFYMN